MQIYTHNRFNSELSLSKWYDDVQECYIRGCNCRGCFIKSFYPNIRCNLKNVVRALIVKFGVPAFLVEKKNSKQAVIL